MIDRHLIHDDARRDEEARSADAVERQQNPRAQENWECEQTENGRNEQRPLRQR